MRVLMLSKACIVGIYQRKLECIAARDVELLTLVPPSWRDERGEQHLERVYTDGYRLQTTPIVFNGNFHLHFYPQLDDYLREFQPDILHIDEEPYNLAAWQALFFAQRRNIKTLFFSWQNILRSYPFPFSRGERWMLEQVDYAIVGTESAGHVWRKKGYQGRLTVIPQFGTDPDLFQPSERPARPFTIGYIGRMVEEKGVHHLLQAAAELPGAWQMRLVGGGPLRDDLADEAARLGLAERVEFIGQIPSTEMPDQYAAIDTLVLPSLTRHNWKEQFGRVLVEAMAAGVPVIGSSSGAIPGVIGNAGLIFPEGDVRALAECLYDVMHHDDMYNDLAAAGRQRVLQHFTHASIAESTVRVYQEMLD